jgi:beta-glucanase (GH16 family)
VGDVWDVPTQAIIFSFFTYNTNPTLDPTQFHTYGVDWESTTITFYIDRIAVGSCPTPSGYNIPMFPIIGYGCGGDWTGSIVNTAALPVTALVDYVAIWPSGKRPF